MSLRSCSEAGTKYPSSSARTSGGDGRRRGRPRRRRSPPSCARATWPAPRGRCGTAGGASAGGDGRARRSTSSAHPSTARGTTAAGGERRTGRAPRGRAEGALDRRRRRRRRRRRGGGRTASPPTRSYSGATGVSTAVTVPSGPWPAIDPTSSRRSSRRTSPNAQASPTACSPHWRSARRHSGAPPACRSGPTRAP